MNNFTIRPYEGTLIGVPWVCVRDSLEKQYDLSELYDTAVALQIVPQLQNELSMMEAVLGRKFTVSSVKSPLTVLFNAFEYHIVFDQSHIRAGSPLPRMTPLPLLQWAAEQSFARWLDEDRDIIFPKYAEHLQTADLVNEYIRIRISRVTTEDQDFNFWLQSKVTTMNSLSAASV